MKYLPTSGAEGNSACFQFWLSTTVLGKETVTAQPTVWHLFLFFFLVLQYEVVTFLSVGMVSLFTQVGHVKRV